MEEKIGECEVVETIEFTDDDKPDDKKTDVTSMRRNMFQRQVNNLKRSVQLQI